MDPSPLWQSAILIALIWCSAFFSSMETALMSLGKLRVRHLVEEGVKGARLVERLLSSPGRLLGTILIGNNLVNIAATAIGTVIAVDYFGEGLGVAIATFGMTVVILIFGEITPKTYGLHHSQRIALTWSPTLNILYLVFNPLARLLEKLSHLLLGLIGAPVTPNAPTFSEEELRTLVTVGQEEGILQAEEKDMITSIIEFGDTLVKNIMTPRTEIVRVSLRTSYEDLLEVVRRDGYSRVPVFDKGIDDIVGVLHVKDLIGAAKESFDAINYLRPPYFVPEFKKVSELLAEFKRKKVHLAIVVDEYGGTAGLITFEDLVEEILGEIADEHDEDEVPEYAYIDECTVELSGTIGIRVASEILGVELPEGEYDTIGGMLMFLMGTIPTIGDSVNVSGVALTIKAMDGSRVDTVTAILKSGE
ncbi:MAG: Hemolysin C [Firmicutes bacterium]|nr:Hemolysin C [Bacillota bacterium]